jgi:hypothetical protein
MSHAGLGRAQGQPGRESHIDLLESRKSSGICALALVRTRGQMNKDIGVLQDLCPAFPWITSLWQRADSDFCTTAPKRAMPDQRSARDALRMQASEQRPANETTPTGKRYAHRCSWLNAGKVTLHKARDKVRASAH